MNALLRIVLLLNVLLVVGCTADTSGNDREYSYTDTWTDPETGLVMLPSNKMNISREEVARIYKQTEVCMGLGAPGPNVQFMSFYEYFHPTAPVGSGAVLGAGGGAMYVPLETLAAVNTDEGSDNFGNPIFVRNAEADREYLSHEFIHHILWMNGISSSTHDPAYFLQECIIENTTD